MLRISKVRSPIAAASYYETDDYYADGKSPSAWVGRGAEALGLKGIVDRDTFQRLLSGEVADQKLGTQRDGKWQHRAGFDLTFSAPKSVSLLAEAAGDRRLIDAHEKAVRQALDYIEREAAVARIHTRQGGDSMEYQNTGNLAVATFRHATSRALDADLHTHAVVINGTKTEDGKWRALDLREMLRIRELAGTIYQTTLARECAQLGYTPERINQYGQFELTEVPAEVRAATSKRTAQAEAWLTAHGHDPEKADRETWQRAILATRAAKKERSMSELRAAWQTELAGLGFDAQAVARQAKARASEFSVSAEKAVTAAIQHLGEREQVFTERELLRVALVHVVGQGITLGDVQREIVRQRERGELRVRDLDGLAYTSRSAIQIEKDMLAAAEKMRGGNALMSQQEASLVVQRAAEAAPHPWTAHQIRATEQILTTGGRLGCVQGLAGTAKTTTVLRTVAAEYRVHGYGVIGVAPTAEAAGILGREIGTQGATLARHLIDAKAGRLSGEKQVWVIDEASLASTKQMRDLLRAADKVGARCILVGDVRQMGSVDAGKAFAQIQERAPTVALEEIVRQRDKELLAGVYAAARGNVKEALDRVEQAGAINELDAPGKRRASAAEKYLSLSAEEREQTIMVATSRAARTDINARVREGLRRDGTLHGEDLHVKTLEARDLTRVEREAAWSYSSGDVVRFGRDYKQTGINRDEYHRVTSVDQKQNRVHLVTQDGREVTWRPDKQGAKTAQVFREAERQVAEGDKLVWSRNDKEIGLKNGERLHVVSVKDHNFNARTQDGRDVQLNTAKEQHRHFTHAYAQTVHSAQGRTAERVICEMSSRSPLATQRSVYVAISRAKQEAHIYTDSKSELARHAQERTGEKTAALEQTRKNDHERAASGNRVPQNIKAPNHHNEEYSR